MGSIPRIRGSMEESMETTIQEADIQGDEVGREEVGSVEGWGNQRIRWTYQCG